MHPRIIEAKTSGIGPSGRNDYGMLNYKNLLIIHGGRDDGKNPYILNDFNGLNLDSL